MVDAAEVDSLDRLAMACPAMPLCGLAIGEAERGLPDILRRLRQLLVKARRRGGGRGWAEEGGAHCACARPRSPPSALFHSRRLRRR